MTIFGTGGNDRLRGTRSDDIFDVTQGGNDRIEGRDGNDTVSFGATLTNRDRIDGGDGFDTVQLDGDYSGGLRFRAASLTGVEVIGLVGGHTYNLTMAEENAAAGTQFSISAFALGAADALIVDASHDMDAFYIITGGAGDDVIIGGSGSAGGSFNLTLGGSDTATATDGVNIFNLGAALDSTDVLNGGASNDFVILFGDYSAGLHITGTMMTDMDVIQASGAFDYNIVLDNRVTDAGLVLAVDGRNIEAGFSLIVDGSAERDSRLSFEGGHGDDTLTGGDVDDTFLMYDGGDDVVSGGGGEDRFDFEGTLDRHDEVYGGGEFDIINLDGDYSGGLSNRHIRSIEQINLADSGHDYSLTTVDANVAAGAQLTIDGNAVGAHALVFDGSDETDGMFDAAGSVGDDTLTGGLNGDTLRGSDGDDQLNGFQGDDILVGGMGADRFNGALGADIYVVDQIAESTGVDHDITTTFNAAVDKFDLDGGVTGIDTKIVAGALSEATFDANLGVAVNAGNLAIGHAVLFDPDTGDLASHIYLIVEANGVAGYQTESDIVFRVDNAINMNSLATTNFI